jgi:hypothetical protein
VVAPVAALWARRGLKQEDAGLLAVVAEVHLRLPRPPLGLLEAVNSALYRKEPFVVAASNFLVLVRVEQLKYE